MSSATNSTTTFELPGSLPTLPVDPADISRRGLIGPCAGLFLATAERERLVHVHALEVPREWVDLGLGAGDDVALAWRGKAFHDAVVRVDGAVVALCSHHGLCEITAAAADPGAALAAAERLADRLRDEPPPADVVPIHFWSTSGPFPSAERRPIEAPEWAEIATNYPAATRRGLDVLMAARERGRGSLLLWHGPPGTGKTHALRALARAWSGWATTHFVTDPEKFLAGTAYLMEVATHGRRERTRLIVLEDAGELMAADARAAVGQGVSRMLNLADGLLGQGLPCVLLVTTNEPIGRLHPAVRRPGRCWAELTFPAFPADEAAAWLALNGGEGAAPPAGAATLAELYARAEGRELTAPEGVAFGFGRASGTVG